MSAGSHPAWVSDSVTDMKRVLGLSQLFLLKRLSCYVETIAVPLASFLPVSLETLQKRCTERFLQVRAEDGDAFKKALWGKKKAYLSLQK